MLLIKRENGKIVYAYEPKTHTNPIEKVNADILYPIIARPSSLVPIHKWYIVHSDVIDTIVDLYYSRFLDFALKNTRYTLNLDQEAFRSTMIRRLYWSSQSRKKNFM